MHCFARPTCLTILLAAGACGGTTTDSIVDPPPPPPPPPQVAAASVKIQAVADTLRQMQTVQLAVTALNASGQAITNASLSWTSLDERVATVDAKGVIVPRKPGSTRIVVRSGTASDTTRVSVKLHWLDIVLSRAIIGACGIAGDSTAYCWGNADLVGAQTPPARPIEVPGGRAFRTITVAGTTACALTGAGEAFCWGTNANGELGNGETASSVSATPMPVKSNGIRFTQIASDLGWVCGLSTTGVVYCWGANGYGQQGATTPAKILTPTVVPGVPRATKVSVGYATGCAVIVDGRVFCWGSDIWGQLGRGTLGGVASGGSILSDFTFKDVAMHLNGGCAASTSGGVYCWGVQGGAVSASTPQLYPNTLDFASIVIGDSNRCGQTPSGTKCWGDNSLGQLGIGDATPGIGPQLIPNTTSFVKLTAGSNAACALTTSGAAYCWGSNAQGQLGDGTTTTRKSPTKVLDPAS